MTPPRLTVFFGTERLSFPDHRPTQKIADSRVWNAHVDMCIPDRVSAFGVRRHPIWLCYRTSDMLINDE